MALRAFCLFTPSNQVTSNEQKSFIANPRNMKSTTLLPIFLLLSTFIVSHLPSATADLVDIDGEIMRNGGTFYILPAFRGMGGGLDLAATGNETCPLTVVQARSEIDNGKPVIIASPLRIAFLSTGLPLYPKFAHVPICAPTPSRWTVVEGLPDEPYALKITGYDNTLIGPFYIQRSFANSYKFTFCPRSGDNCSDVGVRFDENGIRHLALVKSNETPLSVVFKKAGVSSGWNEA